MSDAIRTSTTKTSFVNEKKVNMSDSKSKTYEIKGKLLVSYVFYVVHNRWTFSKNVIMKITSNIK